ILMDVYWVPEQNFKRKVHLPVCQASPHVEEPPAPLLPRLDPILGLPAVSVTPLTRFDSPGVLRVSGRHRGSNANIHIHTHARLEKAKIHKIIIKAYKSSINREPMCQT